MLIPARRIQGKDECSAWILSGKLGAIRGVVTEERRNIMKACINSDGLYGTESLTQMNNKAEARMKILKRKTVKRIMRANQSTANEDTEKESTISYIEIDRHKKKFMEAIFRKGRVEGGVEAEVTRDGKAERLGRDRNE